MISSPQSKKIYWFLVLIFFLLSLTIGTAGYFYYKHQKKTLKQQMWDELNVITNLKVSQLTNWLKERHADAEVIFENQFMVSSIYQWLKKPSDTALKGKITNNIMSLKKYYDYKDVILCDTKGRIVLSTPGTDKLVCRYIRQTIFEAIRTKKVTLVDLHRSEISEKIHLGLIVPLLAQERRGSVPIGILLLQIDPHKFLYSLIQTWPTHSRTAESLLVRREGEKVVFLSELRHQKNTALNVRFPVSEKLLPAAIVVRGYEGVIEGIDYRGIPVLAALRRIPDSSWFLIAKIDQEEIYEPILIRARFMAILVGLLILGTALIIGFLWRGQQETYQKREYEAELKQLTLTKRFDYLTKYANDIILLTDQDLKIVEVNERAVTSYGYSREELLQLNGRDLRTPETRLALEAQIKKVKEQNGFVFETEHQRKDGTRFPVEISSRAIELEGKKFFQSIIRDITERKEAERIIRQERDSVQNYIDIAGVMIVAINSDGRVDLINKKGCEVLGVSEEEVIGQKWFDNFLPERVRYEVKTVFSKLMAGELEPVEYFENPVLTRVGTERTIAWHNTLVKDDKGHIVGTLSSGEDITEQKQREKEMYDLQDQLRQSQKMEAIGRLAGGIAHDFNNLLTVIAGYSQLSFSQLQEGDPLKENITEIHMAAQRAASLTKQLLAFGRRQVMEMKVVDLNTILRDLEKMLRRVIGEDIELITILNDDLGSVKVDPGQIQQVIINLAVNSRDAMPKGGKLTVETSDVDLDEQYARNHISVHPGQYVMLSVSDTGIGMTPETREKVFEPFFTTKEKGKGTGLGLSTVYGIIKQSGGNIWVYSEPDHGTTFKIYLPRVEAPLEEVNEEAEAEAEEILCGNETVLLVEDEDDVRKLAVQFLKKQGYEVLEASNGGIALLICEEHKGLISLMLTDVVMPKMSGSDLASRVTALRPDMKVLYMSGYTDSAIVQHGILEEGTNYIQKPFTLRGLARKVREVLDK